MRTVKVYWTDSEMVNHEFYIEVPTNRNKLDINRLARDTVFDEAVSDYFWETIKE